VDIEVTPLRTFLVPVPADIDAEGLERLGDAPTP
jgi:hypothetical protein